MTTTELTEQQIKLRKEALKQLHLDFFKELQETGLGFHPELRGRVRSESVQLGILKQANESDLYAVSWASEIDLIVENDVYFKQASQINFGTSGAFNPADLAPYWRTKHAAIILDNWELIQGICSKYCTRYVNEFQK